MELDDDEMLEGLGTKILQPKPIPRLTTQSSY